MKRGISWSEIRHADASWLKFLLQSVYDVLTSLANLFTWGKSGITSYPLSAGKGTLRHIMSACPRALGDGRYCWRHNQVLRTVADTVDTAIRTSNYKPEAWSIYFVKAGECSLLRVKLTLAIKLPRLAVESRYRGTFDSSGTDHNNYPVSRFNVMASRNKKGFADRIDSPVGRTYRSGPRNKG